MKILDAIKNNPVRAGAMAGPIITWLLASGYVSDATGMMLAAVLTAYTGTTVSMAAGKKPEKITLTL